MSALSRAALAALALAVAACHHGSDSGTPNLPVNTLPDFLLTGIASTAYDGTTNDLLTAGLGKSGLAGAAPTIAVPASPTVAELRALAIYVNYRALLDMTANGGYGSLYGPNIDVNGGNTLGEGKIAGAEHIAFADDGTGMQNVTLMVQIPNSFSPDNPCIVTATSSGSRGVYGAIGTAGEWGLKHGCAVAYADKGSGNGGHDLAANAVYTMLGARTPAGTAGRNSIFTANLSATDLTAYNAAFPNRWAYKHAHSQQNPEKDWGRDTLRAVKFAFYMINLKYGEVSNGTTYQKIQPSNTIVIASSVSNGAGAAVAAMEQDTEGLLDGMAVAEPQINMNPPAATIRRGTTPVAAFAKPLFDYFSIGSLYQPCAAYAPSNAASPGLAFVSATTAANRCASLAAKGLVTGTTTAEQAIDALARLHAAGWEADSDLFQASHYAFATLSVELTYANAFAKASVKDNLCGYSFGGTPVAGVATALSANAGAQLFGTGNGVPPTSGIVIINNNSVGGAATDAASISPSTGLVDFDVDGAICLRTLYTGTGAQSTTLRASIDATKRSGNLRGRPAVIVHGRSDTLVPVNHTSRPYYALNKIVDAGSKLSYYEVTNAQHFDSFVGTAALAGYDTRLIPLHRYLLQALDIVYANLKSGTAIPPSQVIRTVPRGGTPGAAPAITLANVPAVAATPAGGDAITFSNNTLTIPD